ncbi:MAG TPA: MFS transporter [Candidatus Paceibacterota bacterium]|nr:MFS transporter [Candidatus Paceibacterota bacterium]
MTLKEKRWMLFFIYFTTFLTSIGYAFIIYINSSFLQKFVSSEYIGALYGVSSLVTLIILTRISYALKKIGHFKVMLGIITLETLSVFCSAILDMYSFSGITTDYLRLSLFVILAFLIFNTTAILLRFSLDIYLEKYSKNRETGKARGIFLTTMNLAIAVSPYMVGKILTNGDFWRVYLVASAIFLPAIIITGTKLRKVRDVEYHDTKFTIGLKKVWKNKNIRSIFMTNFLLEFFYSWMTIYTPIYLFKIMGFSWENIGTMFSLMLTSFVILQLPLGKIADKYLGEKEILTAGLIITGLSTSYLAFIEKPEFIVWTAALFMTRVGAAAIEIMNETYFFKKVSPEDSDVIGFFRNASPLAYIIGPMTASVLIYFIDFKYIFAILGVIMLVGIRYSLAIKDTL